MNIFDINFNYCYQIYSTSRKL